MERFDEQLGVQCPAQCAQRQAHGLIVIRYSNKWFVVGREAPLLGAALPIKP